MTYPPLELAEAFIKAGELDDALDALNEHLTDNPDDDNARRLRVAVTTRMGTEEHLLGALDDLDALEAATPRDAYTRSVVLERNGDLPGALEAARDTLTTATDDRLKTDALGRVLALLRATNDLEAALDLALANDWVGWAADAAADLGDPARALPYYNEALARAEKLRDVTDERIADNIRARVLLKRAGSRYAAQDYPAADADYIAAAQTIPDDPMIPFNRGLIAFQQKRPDDAETLFRESYTDAPEALRERMRVAAEESEALAKLWHKVVRAAS